MSEWRVQHICLLRRSPTEVNKMQASRAALGDNRVASRPDQTFQT
jgi:hypothetical protein